MLRDERIPAGSSLRHSKKRHASARRELDLGG
jgi:hypothetical protein